MDIAVDFKDAPEEVRTLLTANPALVSAIGAYVEAAKAPLVSKRDELLGQITKLKSEAPDVEAATKPLNDKIADQDKRIAALTAARQSEKVNTLISTALAEANGDAKLLTPHIQTRLKAEMVGDDVTITVLAADGKPMLVGDKAATVKDLLSELKADASFARGFGAVNSKGSDAHQSTSTFRGLVNPWHKDSSNLTERGRIAKEDPALAAAMRAAAGMPATAAA
jgi:predicted HicB family RNase H-like nuclease